MEQICQGLFFAGGRRGDFLQAAENWREWVTIQLSAISHQPSAFSLKDVVNNPKA